MTSAEQFAPGLDRTAGMGYWPEEDLPFYYGLARTFPLASRWFSACLGPTFPNRRFMIAGTANGLIDDLPFGMIDYPRNGTIFDLLSAHGISWANYHMISPARFGWQRPAHIRSLRVLRLLAGVVAAFVPAAVPALLAKVQVTADLYPLGLLRTINHVHPVTRFWRDARAGKLPAVSIVDPDCSYCSEEFDRYWILRLPRNTALGKRAAIADAGPKTYDRLGFRVPAVIVSPYARPIYEIKKTYDHTSVLKLIQRKWNLPPLTRRDAAASDPLEALDLEAEPSFARPPRLPAPAKPWQR